MGILPSIESHILATVDRLFALLRAQDERDYLGEQVTQLEHSLRCAHLARQSEEYGDDKEVVLSALLYDVGRFVPTAKQMGAVVGSDGKSVGPQGYEVLGESYLRELGYSEKICQLVGARVTAKKYPVSTDNDHDDESRKTSKQTLIRQGGVYSEDPLLEAKLAVKGWAGLAKVPNLIVPPLEAYQEMAFECLLECSSKFSLHSKEYRLPERPTVVVCIDGFDPEYLDSGLKNGILPTFKSFLDQGFHTTAKSCMPSFTNPNNVSIITGAPPSFHGIAGNFFLDRETGKETMITDDSRLRGSTILEQMSQRGVRVAAITAKDKLRRILAHGLQNAICFSAERAADCTAEENGIAEVEEWLGQSAPSQYSGDLSLFVLDAGVKLLEEKRSDFLYLTLSDYIQHKHAPGSEESDNFMMAIDDRLRKLAAFAPIIGVTGDHGMSQKSNDAGEPNVLFLEDTLNDKYGPDATRVICPITDPFVRHHGALGSFVRVYLKDLSQLESMISFCESLPEIEKVLKGKDAAEMYDMPEDREGDIAIISRKHAVIGSRKSEHDLSKVKDHPLRSHGGLSEQEIPLIVSRPIKDIDASKSKAWRNYDLFDLVLNWTL
ncbi:hypothetical protein FQN51_001429 [Onygenales sp. PD_10]|nr:hypothetical protein FQN51_001429 [Onygenales sp. PD_10]